MRRAINLSVPLTNIVPQSRAKISLLLSNWQVISRLKVHRVETFRRDSL